MILKKLSAMSLVSAGLLSGFFAPNFAHAGSGGYLTNEDGQQIALAATQDEQGKATVIKHETIKLLSFEHSWGFETIISGCKLKKGTSPEEIQAEMQRVAALNPRNRTFQDSDYNSSNSLCKSIAFEAGIRGNSFGELVNNCLITAERTEAKAKDSVFQDNSEFCKKMQGLSKSARDRLFGSFKEILIESYKYKRPINGEIYYAPEYFEKYHLDK